jgi:hypothetical protein
VEGVHCNLGWERLRSASDWEEVPAPTSPIGIGVRLANGIPSFEFQSKVQTQQRSSPEDLKSYSIKGEIVRRLLLKGFQVKLVNRTQSSLMTTFGRGKIAYFRSVVLQLKLLVLSFQIKGSERLAGKWIEHLFQSGKILEAQYQPN